MKISTGRDDTNTRNWNLAHATDMTQQQNQFPDGPMNPSNKPGDSILSAGSQPEAKPKLATTLETPADLMAYVQASLGFRPVDSMILVAFEGRQPATVIRCDLPEPLRQFLCQPDVSHKDFLDTALQSDDELLCIEIGQHLGRLLTQHTAPSACMVVYTAENVRVSDLEAIACVGTIHGIIGSQLRLQGLCVDEAWYLSNGHLWHIQCAATLECTVQAVPVGDPEVTTVFRDLDPGRRSAQSARDMTKKLPFPPWTTAVPADIVDFESLLAEHSQEVLDWLHTWDDRLGCGPKMLDTRSVTDLLSPLAYPILRQAVLTTACFDLPTTLRGTQRLVPVLDKWQSASSLQRSTEDINNVTACLEATSPRPPDWQRVAALERLCLQLLPLADNHSGGELAGMLAWIEWARGRGSIAMDYVRQAMKRFPANTFIYEMSTQLHRGDVATWATLASSAWTPQHAA